MKEESVNKARLGVFVLAGTLLLIAGLYYIGSKKNIFHSTIQVSADFNNVNGLVPGNNVRFNGLNVGTVSKVYAASDTIIRVNFTIDKSFTPYITRSTIASIGTDGLLGSKLINLSPGNKGASPVEEDCVLNSQNPIQIDNALRTLKATDDNLKEITDNLKGVSEKFNNSHSLWHLLTDTALAENVKMAVVRFKLTGANAAMATGDLSDIVKGIKNGQGTLGALLTDTMLSHKIKQTIVIIKAISDTVAIISGDFKNVSEKMKSGKGAFGTLLTDTSFVHNLNQSMKNIKYGSGNFNDNMEALKHIWPFKKYFRKKNKSLKTN